ncbi:hypothetical protein [Candidatus Poriferisocius sp.]|uniref:hypothetical protein n=1 Tax=Candidatus Poriferisocius sp. TaxID=3101276 RepID=UPI003B52C6E3
MVLLGDELPVDGVPFDAGAVDSAPAVIGAEDLGVHDGYVVEGRNAFRQRFI